MMNPRDYTDSELEDAARAVNAELYPARAQELADELKRRRGRSAPENPLLDVLCGARVGWTYYEYPLARLRLYHDRIEIVTAVSGRYTLRLEFMSTVRREREILLQWLQLGHTDPASPEYAVWTPDLRHVEAMIEATLAAFRNAR